MTDIQNDEGMNILANRLKDQRNRPAVELLKTASIDTDFNDLVDESFADQENRRFPIFSPEFAVISALHMQTQEVDPLVKQACSNALLDWKIEGISPECAYDKEDIGIPADRFLMPHKLKLPVIDETSLEKSASVLNGIFDQLEIPEKMVASRKLYKFATEEFGMDPTGLSANVVRYAQQSPCDLTKLASSVSSRYAETQNPKYQEFIVKIAALKEDIEGSVSFDTSINSGIALDLFKIDKESGLNQADAIYDTFNAPFMINTEGEMEKVATTNSIQVGRYSISENSLMKIASGEIESVYPGLESKIFEEGVISPEKLVSFTEQITPSAAEEIGRFLSEI